jgi:hypothetical protein
MVAMLRSISIVVAALVLASCASTSVQLALHSAKDPKVSEELQCMTECLEDGSETCEDCVSQCLKDSAGDSVASRD